MNTKLIKLFTASFMALAILSGCGKSANEKPVFEQTQKWVEGVSSENGLFLKSSANTIDVNGIPMVLMAIKSTEAISNINCLALYNQTTGYPEWGIGFEDNISQIKIRMDKAKDQISMPVKLAEGSNHLLLFDKSSTEYETFLATISNVKEISITATLVDGYVGTWNINLQ